MAAALHLNQDDLLTIASLILEVQNNSNNPLKLSLQNLSILYRLSQLPNLTGLSVRESLETANFNSSINVKQQLAASSGKTAYSGINNLDHLVQWLKRSPFAVYEMQFILYDPSIQNKVLGDDAVANFLQGLRLAIEKTLLTQTVFFNTLKTQLEQALTTIVGGHVNKNGQPLSLSFSDIRQLSHGIYSGLKSNRYIGADATVHLITINANNLQTCKTLVTTTIINEFTTLGGEFAKITAGEVDAIISPAPPAKGPNLIDTIVTIINNAYHLQQKTFIEHLASLFSLSSGIAAVLKEWGDLTLEGLMHLLDKLGVSPSGTNWIKFE